jgi:hypothetical protein
MMMSSAHALIHVDAHTWADPASRLMQSNATLPTANTLMWVRTSEKRCAWWSQRVTSEDGPGSGFLRHSGWITGSVEACIGLQIA